MGPYMRMLIFSVLTLLLLDIPIISNGQNLEQLISRKDTITKQLGELMYSPTFRPLKWVKATKYYRSLDSIYLSLIQLASQDPVELYNLLDQRAEVLEYLGRYDESIRLRRQQIVLAQQDEYIKKLYRPKYGPPHQITSSISQLIVTQMRQDGAFESLMTIFLKAHSRWKKRDKGSLATCDIVNVCGVMDNFKYLMNHNEEYLAWQLIMYSFIWDLGDFYNACGISELLIEKLRKQYSQKEIITYLEKEKALIKYPPPPPFYYDDIDKDLPNFGTIQLLGINLKIFAYGPPYNVEFQALNNEERISALKQIFEHSSFNQALLKNE